MKICYITNRSSGGGVANAADDACREAARRGHDVTHLSILKPGQPGPEGLHRNDSLDAETSSDADVPLRFLRWVEQNQPEVILFGAAAAAEEAIPSIPRQVRCIMTVHDAVKKYWRNALRFERDLDAILAVSNYVANRFRDQLQDVEKVRVVLNGVNIPTLQLPLPHRENDICFIGSKTSLKGDGDLVYLWPELLKHGFDGRLHWIGDRDPRVELAVQRLPQSHRIVMHGRIPREQVFDLALRSKVSLALCRCDACPLAAIEAMVLGCYVFTWDIETGIRELLGDQFMETAIPYADYARMASGIVNKMTEGPESFNEQMKLAQQRFSIALMWDNYEQILCDVLTQERPARSRAEVAPSPYRRRREYFPMIPRFIRQPVISFLRRSRQLSVLLRHLRGY
jgi:hypothetical protein